MGTTANQDVAVSFVEHCSATGRRDRHISPVSDDTPWMSIDLRDPWAPQHTDDLGVGAAVSLARRCDPAWRQARHQ